MGIQLEMLFTGTGAADWPREYEASAAQMARGAARGNASLLLNGRVLVDCGPTVPEVMHRLGVDPRAITDLLLTHAHGDHFDPGSVQRLVEGRRAVNSPGNVGGRRAHPPTIDKVWEEKINKKERRKARRVALAATTSHELVSNRGHRFNKKLSLPLVMEDKFEKVDKTKNALEIFKNIVFLVVASGNK